MPNLRQVTWRVLTKPFSEFNGDKHVYRGNVSFPSPSQPCSSNCTSYLSATGEAWILFKETTSFVEVREAIKELMDVYGISRNDIFIAQVIPTDHIITPIA